MVHIEASKVMVIQRMIKYSGKVLISDGAAAADDACNKPNPQWKRGMFDGHRID
jgi:hypothetical protein